MKNEVRAGDRVGLPETGVPPVSEPGSRARTALWLVLALVLLHASAVALWVGPENLLREKIGTDRLSSYILPMFDQNWSVFAPEADFGNDMLEIRATVTGPDGRDVRTDWVKVTAREIVPAVRYHPFPSRTTAITNRLATENVQVFGALGAKQQAVIATADQHVSLDGLRAQLLAAATSDTERTAVTGYLKVETAVEYFLSGIANAIWGDKLVMFQFRRNRQLVTNYETSRGTRVTTGAYTFTTNWRPVHALTAGDRAVYAAYVRKFDIG